MIRGNRQRLFDAQKMGSIRTAIDVDGLALQVLKPSVRNQIVREALISGGQMWLTVFMPLRFTPYAKRLGYPFKTAHPFIDTGNMQRSVMASAKATATATSTGRAVILLSMTYGHPVRTDIAPAFRTVPGWEVERVAQAVASYLIGAQEQIIEVAPARTKTGKERKNARTTFRRAQGPVMAAGRGPAHRGSRTA
jgi:hypothetical protein